MELLEIAPSSGGAKLPRQDLAQLRFKIDERRVSRVYQRRFELALTHRLAIQHQHAVVRFLQTLAGILCFPATYRN
jgi:hypothetical protein